MAIVTNTSNINSTDHSDITTLTEQSKTNPEKTNNYISPQNEKIAVNTDVTKRKLTNILLKKNEEDNGFNEVVRRIKKPLTEEIHQQLALVTKEELLQLNDICNKPELIITTQKEFFTNDKFPYIALKSLSLEKISVFEFATLQSLFSQCKDYPSIIYENKVTLYQLFDENDSPNEQAWKLIMQTIDLSNFFHLDKKQVIAKMQKAMLEKSPVESCFWLLDIPSSDDINQETIYIRIQNIGFKIFTGIENKQSFPSTTVRQEFIKAAFLENACTINPVIGTSSVKDIRACGYKYSRDFAVPFPKLPLPKEADRFLVKEIFEFQYHDFYHVVRMSLMPHEDISFYLMLGDELEELQQRYTKTIKVFIDLVAQKKQQIDDFNKKLASMNLNDKFKDEIKSRNEKFKYEFCRHRKILAVLKNMRKATGKLKYFLYDLEIHGYVNKYNVSNKETFHVFNIINALLAINSVLSAPLKGRYSQLAGKVTFNFLKAQFDLCNICLNIKDLYEHYIKNAKDDKARETWINIAYFIHGGLSVLKDTVATD